VAMSATGNGPLGVCRTLISELLLDDHPGARVIATEPGGPQVGSTRKQVPPVTGGAGGFFFNRAAIGSCAARRSLADVRMLGKRWVSRKRGRAARTESPSERPRIQCYCAVSTRRGCSTRSGRMIDPVWDCRSSQHQADGSRQFRARSGLIRSDSVGYHRNKAPANQRKPLCLQGLRGMHHI
jgi:hypothetical protein